MTEIFVFLFQYADAIALLVLSAIGLVVIFGMMGVINMAHGELMMIGAFATAYSYFFGVPIPLAILMGGLAAMVAGIILERLIIRHFYGRLLASLVATWGVSLILTQGTLIVLGPSIQSLPTVFGSFSVGDFTFSFFRLFLFSMAVVMVTALWMLLKYTSFGLDARATMDDPSMARALGINTTRVYVLTFGLGAFLAGISGGLFALTAPVEPTFGHQFTPIAFIVVVVAGSVNIIAGFLSAVLMLALVKTVFTAEFNILLGHVGMLLAAFLIIRLAPGGIQDLLQRMRRALVPGRASNRSSHATDS